MPTISLTSLLHVARAGLRAHQLGVDVTANNIANVNTAGFRRSRAEFHELLNEELEAPPEGSDRTSGQGAGTVLVDNQRLFNQGNIEHTGSEWDLAIQGDGFFQIQLADGSMAYTRDGSFRLDGEGRVVIANGYFLSPGLTIPPDAEETVINSDGSVMVRRRGETEPQIIATVQLARFINPAGLEKIGETLFQPSDSSGQPQLGQPGTGERGQILRSALEKSNVDLSEEIVNLINAQRAYSLMVRAMETSDEMLSLANQLR
jgi:flagellar basal-body rod protein FlgG